MKSVKRIVSVLLAMLLVVGLLPLSVSAASLKITTQPKTSYTAYGSTAKATIKASGSGLKYTWYIKNAGAKKYSKSSVTKSTYSAKMTDSAKNRSVYCVVKDKKGKTIKSKTAILRMKATITTQPVNCYVPDGSTAKLTVKAKGDSLKYTWYIKNDGAKKYSKSSIKKATYSATMSSKVHNRYAYCVVTDKYGKTAKSKTVLMRSVPVITTQPENTFAVDGGKATFTLSVSGGTKPYTYQWQKIDQFAEDWKDIKSTFVGYSGYNTATLTAPFTSEDMDFDTRYRCVVTDAKGKQAISKEVSAAEKMVITSQPVNEYSNPGNQCTFKVAVSGGAGGYTYQWQWSDYSQPWQDLVNYELASGVKTNTLDVIATEDDFNYETKYRCVITDEKGQQVISNTVWVERSLYIKTQPVNYAAAVDEGARFEVVVAGGKGPYTYQWQFTSDRMGGWSSAAWASGATTATMSFKVTSTQEWTENYRYRCVITDATGKTVTTNTVKVLNKDNLLRITSQPVNDYGRHGQQCTFTVQVAGGNGPYTYQWQWSDYSQPWRNLANNEFASGVKTNMLDVIAMEVDFDYETKYRCIITDADGNQVITNAVWVVEY